MRKALAHIFVLLVALIVAASCAHRAKMIPDSKLKKIYFEMFVADQWLRDTPSARAKADTTLFFDPIFKKYGYTFADYTYTVSQKVKSPEDFSKLLNEVSEELKKVSEEDKKIVEARDAIAAEIRKLKKYDEQDFSSDSSRWEGHKTLWPIFEEPLQDSIFAQKHNDSLMVVNNVKILHNLPASKPKSPEEMEMLIKK